jgi:hypothetical protein
VTSGSSGTVVKPVATLQTAIGPAPEQAHHQPHQRVVSARTLNVSTPTLRTHMLSRFLCCCHRLNPYDRRLQRRPRAVLTNRRGRADQP